MPTKKPWFPFYAGDFVCGCKGLTLEQTGLYIKLLSRQWDRGEFSDPLPGSSSERDLARWCEVDVRQFRRIWEKIRHKFSETSPGLLGNFRLISERSLTEVREDLSRKAALSLHHPPKKSLPSQSQSQSQSQTEQKKLTLCSEPATAPRFDFDAIYALHPRKLGKTEGLKRCKAKIKTQEQYDRLLKAAKNHAEQMRLEGRSSDRILYFSSFMNVWEDYEKITPTATEQRRGRLTEPLANYDHLGPGAHDLTHLFVRGT